MTKKEKKKMETIIVAMPSCSYCDKIPVEDIFVCEDHLKVLDKIASRRQKK